MKRQSYESPNGDQLPGRGDPPGASEADQAASIRDQTASDADQTSSDADQTAADADQTASDRDQLQAEADERSAQRDQKAADRDLSNHPSESAQRDYDLSQLSRERSGLERQATALTRAQVAARRDRQAVQREVAARGRDATAADRDRTAEIRDRALFETAEGQDALEGGRLKEAVEAAAELRSHAAADRSRAAQDRARAATDREEAALDRRQLYAALDAAHLDELTGAYRRGMGEIVLHNELVRAQGSGAALTLAAIDADDLGAINDAHGHAAGDALLRDIAAAVRAQLRPSDPLVRIEGDAFLCTIAGSGLEESRRRIAAVSAALSLAQPGASIGFGLAEMRPEDTLETLIERGHAALDEVKQKR